MELRQLAYLVAVVEEASFTRAAERVHVAQPGVSAQIRRLERELGYELLDRSGRTVRPTEVGTAVLPWARAALAAVAGVRQAVDELTGLVRGHVAVGMVVSAAPLGVPDLLTGFHAVHPAVEITLTEAVSDDLLDALQTGRLDLAVVGLATPPPAGIATEVLADEPLVAAVAPTDLLAPRTSVALAALADRPLMCLPRGSGLRTSLDAGSAVAGVRPRIAFEAGDPHVLAGLAERGLGVAVLPRSLVDAHGPGLVGVPIVRPRLRARLELAWRADGPASPAGRALVAFARDHAGGRAASPT